MGSFRFAWTDQVRAKETDWSSETGIYLIKFDLKGYPSKRAYRCLRDNNVTQIGATVF